MASPDLTSSTGPTGSTGPTSYPRWIHEGSCLRQVSERLHVGGMGAFERGASWGAWIDLAEDEIRATAPALSNRRDRLAMRLAPEHRLRVQVEDGRTLPSWVFDRSLALMASTHGSVLVSCAVGISRSASVAYALLRAIDGLSHDEAYARVEFERWPRLSGSPLTSARAWVEGRR